MLGQGMLSKRIAETCRAAASELQLQGMPGFPGHPRKQQGAAPPTCALGGSILQRYSPHTVTPVRTKNSPMLYTTEAQIHWLPL